MEREVRGTLVSWIQALLPLLGAGIIFYATQTATTAVLAERLDSLIRVTKEMKDSSAEDRKILLDHEKRLGRVETLIEVGRNKGA